MLRNRAFLGISAVLVLGFGCVSLWASSHREAPAITEMPKVDGTDFYFFHSYESGRSGFVTLVANYLPLQDPYGGPNYFTLDPRALYEIHVDNNADAVEDLTFQFRFQVERRDLSLLVGDPGAQKNVAVPVINVGSIQPGDNSLLNVLETFTLNVVYGDRRSGDSRPVLNAATLASSFIKPVDNIGEKSIPDYATYARAHVYEILLPDGSTGRLFVGQRKDPFVVNLGETFDLVNIENPLGPPNAEQDDLADKNVTSLILELPVSFLTAGSPIVGAWTSASVRVPSKGGTPSELIAYRQVSRLGHPLVNEVVIGLKDKDLFNGSEPKNDPQFLDYVTHPTLPEILELLFGAAGVQAPNKFPREDLVAAFLTGLKGLNADGSVGEILRLNTSIPPRSPGAQNNLGVIGGDVSGFPNGRRPGDDVVDIALRVVMGKLLPPSLAPSGQLPFTDGAYVDALSFDFVFPYLKDPIPGAVN